MIAALGLLVFSSTWDAAGQGKKPRRSRTRRTTANTNVAPAPTPSPAPTPAEPEPVKKNERVAETPAPTPEAKTADANAPNFTYEFTQPASLVTRVRIQHDAQGRGTMTFERRTYQDPVTDPLQLSETAVARIKLLWDALNFLDSDKSYQTERDYSHMGTTHLTLQMGTRHRTAEFNWTDNKDAAALAGEYRKAGEQAILVFDLNFARESQPLSAPDLMRRFETMLKSNGFSDVKQLIPLLQDLSVDERIPLIARNHAARLLKQVNK
jgi:hypothetical protein